MSAHPSNRLALSHNHFCSLWLLQWCVVFVQTNASRLVHSTNASRLVHSTSPSKAPEGLLHLRQNCSMGIKYNDEALEAQQNDGVATTF